MLYCIKNNKNVYIKLNDNGQPVTCVKSIKGSFEYSKAKNILNSLPKSLKRLNFKIEAIPDITPKKEDIHEVKQEKKCISNVEYVVSDDITRWVDQFGKCSDILNEAQTRKSELIEQLNNCDKEILDVLHIIEIEKSKDLFSGWKLYKQIKVNRERRRKVKDELLIIENVLHEINPSCVQREKIQKAIDGLLGRKYTFRIVEEVVDENL